MNTPNWRQLDMRIYAVAASLLISGILQLFPYAHTPNDDAYTYIRTAEIFLADGIAAAFAHYSWAGYAVLIGLVSKLGLDLFSAAHLINALFYALLVFAFVSIIREINTAPLIGLLASVVILVYPQLNEYRGYVIRDIGFWALTLTALWLFLQFAKSGAWHYAVAFCAALLLATALRPEALFYLLFTPFTLLFDTRHPLHECRHRFLTLAGVIGGIGLAALLVLLLNGVNIFSQIAEFVSVYQPFLRNTFNPDPAQAEAMGSVLFGEHATDYSQEYIALFMAAGLTAILAANLFNGIGGPYLWILVYGAIQKQLGIRREVAVPMLCYLLTNALILLGFLFITRYLTSRYAIMFSLMLVLLVPQVIAWYLQNKSESRRRAATAFVVLYLTYCAFDSYISFGDNKRYVYDAIDWLQVNSLDNAALVTNNPAIAYFTGKVPNYDEVERNLTQAQILNTRQGDMLAIEMNFAMSQMLASPPANRIFERVLVLPDPGNERLVILQRIAP